MKIIYVAGPYRGVGWNKVWENIMAARYYARALWLRGWAVICPHANSILMDGPELPDQTFLDGDLEILRRCDAVLMIPGWAHSVGARGERQAALDLHIPVYHDIAEVPDGRV